MSEAVRDFNVSRASCSFLTSFFFICFLLGEVGLAIDYYNKNRPRAGYLEATRGAHRLLRVARLLSRPGLGVDETGDVPGLLIGQRAAVAVGHVGVHEGGEVLQVRAHAGLD